MDFFGELRRCFSDLAIVIWSWRFWLSIYISEDITILSISSWVTYTSPRPPSCCIAICTQ